MALQDELNMIDQIPEDTKMYLYRNFMFDEFLNRFKKFFSIPNEEYKGR